MPNFDNLTPPTTAFIDTDNNVQDIKQVLESGSIVVNAVSSPDPITPIGEATTPKFDNIPPWVGKFLDSNNDLYDLLAFLTSGAIQVQVTGSVAPIDSTYITSTDETGTLPNSFQLLGSANQIIVLDGALSLAEDLILPGTLTLTGLAEGVIKTPNGKNLTLAPGNPNLDWVDLQSKTVNVLQSIIFNNAPTNNIFYNSADHEFYFNANNDRVLSLSSSGISLGANLLLGTHKITSSAGTSIQLIPDDDADGIDLASTIVRVDQDIRHSGDPDNKISFTTSAQTHYIDGTSIFDINASGFRIGSGQRVNTISADPTTVLATDLMNAQSTQIAIANAGLGNNAFRDFWDASGGTYPTTGGTGVAGAIEKGNWWRISVPGTLGGIDVKVGDEIFAMIDVPLQVDANWLVYTLDIYNASYITSADETSLLPNSFQLLGTTNEIDVTDGVLSLSPTMVLPGTLTANEDVRINNFLITLESGQTMLTTVSSGGEYVGDLIIQPSYDDYSSIYLKSGTDINIIAGQNEAGGSFVLGSFSSDGWNVIFGPGLVIETTNHHAEINRIKYPRGIDVAANGGVRIVTYNDDTFVKGIESFIPLNDGQLLVGSTLGPPAAANVTSTNGLDIVNGANTIEINSKIYRFSVTVSQASLAAGGSATLFAGVASKQFKILNLWTNFGGTNFAGGGGDRLLSITDNTTVYSVVPAASLQALGNTGWGATGLPYPASAAIDTSTASGQSLVAKYSGGTTDYATGSVTISGLLQFI